MKSQTDKEMYINDTLLKMKKIDENTSNLKEKSLKLDDRLQNLYLKLIAKRWRDRVFGGGNVALLEPVVKSLNYDILMLIEKLTVRLLKYDEISSKNYSEIKLARKAYIKQLQELIDNASNVKDKYEMFMKLYNEWKSRSDTDSDSTSTTDSEILNASDINVEISDDDSNDENDENDNDDNDNNDDTDDDIIKSLPTDFFQSKNGDAVFHVNIPRLNKSNCTIDATKENPRMLIVKGTQENGYYRRGFQLFQVPGKHFEIMTPTIPNRFNIDKFTARYVDNILEIRFPLNYPRNVMKRKRYNHGSYMPGYISTFSDDFLRYSAPKKYRNYQQYMNPFPFSMF